MAKQKVFARTVTTVTCLVVGGSPPHAHGNCFSMKTDDGKNFKIVNFVHENFEHLVKCGLELPVALTPISERHAVVDDPRIPLEFYQSEYCSVCCPSDLWPEPQQFERLRKILRGEMVVKPPRGDGSRFDCGYVSIHPDKRPTIGLPPKKKTMAPKVRIKFQGMMYTKP